ncbi:MAG: DUF4097 family beta strand repeat protein [Acidimicrobiia bacterium]|nr:DUF4097 family beta strand repeat protein [Acidimicrobiia bacterium]
MNMTTNNTNDKGSRSALIVVGVAVLILGIAAVALGTVGGFVSRSQETTEHDAEAVSLDLRASGGVEIIGADTDTITVESRISDPWGRLTTEETVEDGTLTIKSHCAVAWLPTFGDCSAHYVLTVPTATEVTGGGDNGDIGIEALTESVDVSTANGEITVVDVDGRVDLRTDNGDVEVSGANGDVTVQTSNGSVDVLDTTAPEMIDVTTSNGAVKISNTTGDLRLETDNGQIDITDAQAGTISALTSNEAIIMNLSSSPERITAQADNGEIEIGLPQDAPAYDIEMTTNNATSNVEGIVDDPNAPFSITATTSNGDIWLGLRP